MDTVEIWKPIPGFPEHEASSHKRFRHGSRILSKYIGSNGYEMIGLCNGGKKYNKTVHKLLALTFIPNPNNYPCVGHLDDNPLNNDLSNLYWTTYKENNNHGRHNKMISKAMQTPVTKINPITGEELDFFHGAREAEQETGINKSHISQCCTGNNKRRKTAGGYGWKYSETLF